MDNPSPPAKARPGVARRVVLIALGLIALNLSLVAGCFLSKWIPAGHSLAREQVVVDQEIDALYSERVMRPVFLGPPEDGNSWDLLTEGLEGFGSLTEADLDAFPGFMAESGAPAPSPEEMARILAKVEPCLQTLKKALRRPHVQPDYHYQLSFSLPMPLVPHSVRACRILSDRAVSLHAEGKTREATELLILGWGLVDHLAVKGGLVNELVRISMGKLMADRLRDFLSDHALDSATLDDLERALAAMDDARPDILATYRRDDLLSRYGVLDVAAGGSSAQLYPGKRLIGMPWHFFSVRIMAEEWVEIRATLLKGIESAMNLPLRERLTRLDQLETEALDKKNLFVPLLMPDVSRCWRHHATDSVRMSLARLALAVARHREGRGVFPASLDALVPAYLPAIPRDEFSGHPFSYSYNEYTAEVYSWGEDGDDDGGTAIMEESNDDGDVEDGDIVWTIKKQGAVVK